MSFERDLLIPLLIVFLKNLGKLTYFSYHLNSIHCKFHDVSRIIINEAFAMCGVVDCTRLSIRDKPNDL